MAAADPPFQQHPLSRLILLRSQIAHCPGLRVTVLPAAAASVREIVNVIRCLGTLAGRNSDDQLITRTLQPRDAERDE